MDIEMEAEPTEEAPAEWGEEEAAPVEGGEEEELRQDMEGEQGEGEEGEAKVEEEEDIDREQG